MSSAPSHESLDPRLYQIGALAGLLAYGVGWLDFDVTVAQATVILATVLATQYVFDKLWRRPGFDPKSALISGLSLCLLLRTNHLWLAAVTAAVTIASKFTIRVAGKHLFNPTNFGIVAMLLSASDLVWVSSGQWGSTAFLAFLTACLGGLIVNRAARADVALAFLASYGGAVLLRSAWLGEPIWIPLHRLETGALLLFTFFMISDPKTTPDSRSGRILFAFLVGLGAYFVQFICHRPNGLLWSLASCSLVVPLIDRMLPGVRYEWSGSRLSLFPLRRRLAASIVWQRGLSMKGFPGTALALLIALGSPAPARAFCGFYVARADTKLFNQASQVVIARNEDKTVLTMANDFRGDAKEFAIVIPVPTFIEKDQIHVADRALLEHLDAYSAPRLVEYFDENPCAPRLRAMMEGSAAAPGSADSEARAKSLGVTIEARYTVGEYDILILSAEQSSGLETWLRENGYRIPEGATAILGSYLKQGMRFFVAKVNLEEQAKLGFSYLRPIQVAYESPKFMLPIRLGMVNADGPQELFIYALTRKGRVETTNYRTTRLPSGMDIPEYVKSEFGDFYKAMFAEQVKRENMQTVFLEYAWDMNWCDPCAADPLSGDELRNLGVFWLGEPSPGEGVVPPPRPPVPGGPWSAPGARDVFITRLHVRYDLPHFPEDLVFQETADRTNFQGRYVLRHPWTGSEQCPAVTEYKKQLRDRREKEAQTLASLTGWEIEAVRRKMNLDVKPSDTASDGKKWYQRLWSR